LNDKWCANFNTKPKPRAKRQDALTSISISQSTTLIHNIFISMYFWWLEHLKWNLNSPTTLAHSNTFEIAKHKGMHSPRRTNIAVGQNCSFTMSTGKLRRRPQTMGNSMKIPNVDIAITKSSNFGTLPLRGWTNQGTYHLCLMLGEPTRHMVQFSP
jgi:hypothetical protein